MLSIYTNFVADIIKDKIWVQNKEEVRNNQKLVFAQSPNLKSCDLNDKVIDIDKVIIDKVIIDKPNTGSL